MSLFSKEIVLLFGKIMREPESRFTNSGVQTLSFPLRIDRSYKNDAGEWINQGIWYNIACFGNQAKLFNDKLHKGTVVQVLGILECDYETGCPRIWTGNDGKPRASFQVKAQTIVYGGNNEMAQAAVDLGGIDENDNLLPEDDIPF